MMAAAFVASPFHAAEYPGEGLLVGDPLQQPNPVDDSDRPALPEGEQPDEGSPREF